MGFVWLSVMQFAKLSWSPPSEIPWSVTIFISGQIKPPNVQYYHWRVTVFGIKLCPGHSLAISPFYGNSKQTSKRNSNTLSQCSGLAQFWDILFVFTNRQILPFYFCLFVQIQTCYKLVIVCANSEVFILDFCFYHQLLVK